MKSDIFLEPESEEDVEFLDLLAACREFALEEAGLSHSEAAVVFNQFAIGLLLEDSSGVSETTLDCPECGDVLTDVEIQGIGMDPIGVPCGCELERGEVPKELIL